MPLTPHTNTDTHISIYVYIPTCHTHTHTYITHTHTTHTKHVHIHLHIYIYIYRYTYIYIHIYIQMHAQIRSNKLDRHKIDASAPWFCRARCNKALPVWKTRRRVSKASFGGLGSSDIQGLLFLGSGGVQRDFGRQYMSLQILAFHRLSVLATRLRQDDSHPQGLHHGTESTPRHHDFRHGNVVR